MYQTEIREWVVSRLGEASMNPKERALRMLEEALELAQSCGVFEGTANRLLRLVYSKPIGNTEQEIGGTMVTLFAVAEAYEINAMKCLSDEFFRIQQLPPERFVKRQEKNFADGVGDKPMVLEINQMNPDTNFPLKVICPECRAAISAKCQEKYFSLGGSTRNVDWFHFARIEKAKVEGFDITSTPFAKTGLERF